MTELFAFSHPAAALSPGGAGLDSVSVGLPDSEPVSHVALASTEREAHANVCALGIAELAEAIGFAARHSVLATPFGEHVTHVVRMRANAEMSRVDARRVIAGVEDVEAIRDVANIQLVTQPVSFVARIVVAYKAVSGGFAYPPNPQPAPIGLLDILPEPLFQGARDPSSDSLTSGHRGQTSESSEHDWTVN